MEVSHFLLYRQPSDLTDLDSPQVCNYGTSLVKEQAHAYAHTQATFSLQEWPGYEANAQYTRMLGRMASVGGGTSDVDGVGVNRIYGCFSVVRVTSQTRGNRPVARSNANPIAGS